MEIQLFVKTKSDGSVRSFNLPAGPPVVIGRNPEAVVPLEGSALSRDHFGIQYRDNAVWINDTSSNGTWVNGELIGRGSSRAVGIADLIEVAGYQFNYKLIGSSEPPKGPPAAPASRAPVAGTPAPLPAAISPFDSVLDQVRGFVGPFGGAEKVAVMLILSAIALVLIYFYS